MLFSGIISNNEKHTRNEVDVLPFIPSYTTNYLQSNKPQVFFLG